MGGAVPPLPQYAFMAWCSGGADGQLLPYLLSFKLINFAFQMLPFLVPECSTGLAS
jgi:hypothetical protein